LYLLSRNSNDEKLKRRYQAYCNILHKVIKEAKKLYYDTKIQKSNNKCKATWEFIKKLINNHYSHTDIQELMTDNKHLKDQQDIADAFNDYFSSKVDNINKKKVNNKNNNAKVFLTQYYLEQNYAHPPPSLVINRLTPNDPYMGRTAPLTSKRCILHIYSTNIGTEYFKHGLYTPFFSLQNAVCFIMLTCLVPVLLTFCLQNVLKLKKIIPAPKG
jgi:superoxide dismutase